MPDLQDGETIETQGSGAKPYVLENTGGAVGLCVRPAGDCQNWQRKMSPINLAIGSSLHLFLGRATVENYLSWQVWSAGSSRWFGFNTL